MSQINYNRKKDLEFNINSWSFFFSGLFFFHSPYNKKVTENELLGILMITIIICSSFLPQIGVAIAATFLILSKRIESTSIKRALRIVCVAAFFFSAYNLIEISKIMFVKYEGTVIPLN